MEYNKLEIIESYYYESPEHVIKVDIAKSLSNKLAWKKYSIASLGDIISMEPLDEQNEKAVINKQLNIIETKATERKNNTIKHF
ncbi:hypothetical protein ACW5YJ_10335 [Staphylococcus sp. mip270_02]